MGMQQTPRKRRSPWARYAPIIVIVVIVAIVGVALATRKSGKSNNNVSVGSNNGSAGTSGTNGVPLFYNDAKAKGQVAKYQWHNCDTSTGRVAIPVLNPPPCVPEFTGNNGGATAPGVTADTIRIGVYIAKPDPIGDALLKATGTYDPPDNTYTAYQKYAAIYAGMYELYGRKVQIVRINGTGSISDPVAARADADTAASKGVFAVVGGPAQAREFGQELAAKHVLCVGTCMVAQPEKWYTDHEPYLWPLGPSPEQSSSMVTEFIKKQLAGKPAEWAGGSLKGQTRTFTLLTYDTPDGQFKASWDDLAQKTKDAGVTVKAHVDYYLDFAKLQSDAKTIATKLRQAGSTSILFTGDPLFPKYLTEEMTKQNYFPEWVMSGTVFADTNVFARSFDQQQWQHAFGLQLVPARVPKTNQDSFTLYRWWYNADPPTQNNFAVVKGDVELLFQGLQLSGPNLTTDQFKAGMDAAPPIATGNTIQTVTTYGPHGFWPGEDPAGLDNAGLLYWDPNATGQDETGKFGTGMYRLMNGGLRYLPGRWPTAPLALFDPTNTVTIYSPNDIPPSLVPKPEPVPASAPAHGA